MMNKYLRYADILRQCKENHELFICNRIKFCTNATTDECLILQNWIGKQLDRYATYELWLKKHYPNIWRNDYKQDRLTGREQWLDAMIKQLEEWGR